jgi:hypothetical protein
LDHVVYIVMVILENYKRDKIVFSVYLLSTFFCISEILPKNLTRYARVVVLR